MSDHIRRSQVPHAELLDTVSYYDNSEPNWNEFPYFTAVEASRGKSGLHLDGSFSERTLKPIVRADSLQLWPGADHSGSDLDARLHKALGSRGFRVILSGLGGDEVLGGVPTPFPELADLLVKGNLLGLSKSSIEWCLAKRVPFAHLLLKTLDFAVTLYFKGSPSPQTVPSWLSEGLRLRSYDGSLKETIWSRLHCSQPSRLANAQAWWSVLETLPTRLLSREERFERRYPFLDRDLVEFLFCIPRRQLLEPGRRRSLMRRALKNIVPKEILDRRRKAFLIHGPINLIHRERDWLAARFGSLHSARVGLVDPASLQIALDSIAVEGEPQSLPYLMRFIAYELWLDSAPISIPPAFQVGTGDQDPSRVVLTRTS